MSEHFLSEHGDSAQAALGGGKGADGADEAPKPHREPCAVSHKESWIKQATSSWPDPAAATPLTGTHQPLPGHSSASERHTPAGSAPNAPGALVAVASLLGHASQPHPCDPCSPNPRAPSAHSAPLPMLPHSLSMAFNSVSGDAPPTPAPAPKAPALSPDQVAAAAAAWHQHAAAGADDESLLVLARALGLVMQDADGGLLLHPQLVAGLEAPAAPSTSLPSLPNPASGSSMLSGAQLLTSQLQGGQGQLLLQQPQQLSSAVPAAAMPAAILCQQLQAQQQQQQQQVSALAAAGLAALLSSGLSVAQCASLGLSLAAPGGAGATAGAGAARHSHSSGSGLGPVKQHALYKTEMCKGWMEAGTCRYGHKCQFAHGAEELRPVPRHPKYKTEVCRTFTLSGTCVYGARCRFLHAHTSAPNALFNGDGLLLLGETGEESGAHLAEEVQLEGSWDTQLRAGQRAHLVRGAGPQGRASGR
ncbi:hypothetical protein V8C86DRAFT_275650 [Haematococcus lacustris]